MRGARVLGLIILTSLLVTQACEESPTSVFDEFDTPVALSDSDKKLDHIAMCEPTGANFPAPLSSTNPYFPLDVGYQWTLEGEEDGLAVEALITVLPETRTIDGILARVIEEREWEENEDTGEIELVEISWNYFSENAEGTVCYRGEDVDDIEDGEVVEHEGRWCSADPGNHAGVFMPSTDILQPGVSFLQEDAPGIALDGAKVIGAGPGPTADVFGGPYTDTVRFQEFTLIEGHKEKADVKWFGADVGILIDGPLVLTDFTTVAVGPPPPTISEQICGS